MLNDCYKCWLGFLSMWTISLHCASMSLQWLHTYHLHSFSRDSWKLKIALPALVWLCHWSWAGQPGWSAPQLCASSKAAQAQRFLFVDTQIWGGRKNKNRCTKTFSALKVSFIYEPIDKLEKGDTTCLFSQNGFLNCDTSLWHFGNKAR